MGEMVRTVKTFETTAGGRFSGSRNKCYDTPNTTYNTLNTDSSLSEATSHY